MPAIKDRKFKKFLFPVLLIAASVAFALVLTEAGMRVYSYFDPEFLQRFSVEFNTSSPTQYDPQLAYKYKPNSSQWYIRSSNFANEVHINHQGFHDRDFNPQKPQDTYRIVVVGDSYVACQEVPLEKNWMHVLENKLNETSDKNVEIYSLGVHGYSNSNIKDLVFFEALKLEMDMLLYVHFINDIFDDLSYKSYRHSYKNVEFVFNHPDQIEKFERYIDSLELSTLRKNVAWLFYNFYFVRPAVSMLLNRFKQWEVSKMLQKSHLSPIDINEPVVLPSADIDLPQRAAENVLEISNALKKRDISFGFVWLNVPDTGDDGRVMDPHSRFKQLIMESTPLPFDFSVETRPFLKNLQNEVGVKYRFPDDVHFSEYGNQQFGEFIYQNLKTKLSPHPLDHVASSSH